MIKFIKEDLENGDDEEADLVDDTATVADSTID